MKKNLKLHILATLLLIVSIVQGQVSNYTFSQKVVDVGSYSNYLASGYIGTVTIENNSKIYHNAGKYLFLKDIKDTTEILSGKGYNIGFDFYYDEQWMDWVGISSNSYIKLANSNNGNLVMHNDSISGDLFALGMDTLRSNLISSLQINSSYLIDSKLWICYLNYGYPGNRDFRIMINPGYGDILSMSTTIILHEWKNEIQFFYTGMNVKTLSNTEEAYCGLRGGAYNNEPANLNIRKITNGVNTWSNSIDGDSSSSHCDYNKSLTPTHGLVYAFTPPPIDILRTPVAFFKFNSWDSIPKFNSIGKGSTFGYVWADNATEIPTNVSLSWSPEYTSSTNYYKIYLGTDSLDMDILVDSLIATEYELPVLAAGITYYYKIVGYNASGAAEPCVGSFTTANKLLYCTPSWGGNAFIKTITFNSLLYNYPGSFDTRRELPPEFPYTTTLQRDSTYLFSIIPLDDAGCFGTRCWIDFNHNGVFDTSTEQFENAAYITVPHDAILGTTKMRVGKMLCTSQASQFYPCSTEMQYQDFTITIAPNDDCTNFSLTADISNTSCFGENTGEIQLNFLGGTSPYTIQWQKDGTTLSILTQNLSNISRGTYQAFVTDSKDCSVQTELLALTQPLPITVDTVTVTDTLIVSIIGGTAPYYCQWKGEDNSVVSSDCIPPDSVGVYNLTVTDANNCSLNIDSITIQEKIPNAIHLVKGDNTLSVFPNPVRASMTISGKDPITKVEITDMSGKIIYTLSKLNRKIVNLTISNLPSGLYLIKAYTTKGIATKEIIKQ